MRKKKKKSDKNKGDLTLSKQKYLETIYNLQKSAGSDGHTHVKDIAEQLKIKMASVTGAARELERMNLINYSARRQISLTEEGLSMALNLDRKHRVLYEFLHEILGCPKDRAEYFACEIEHIIDGNFLERLEKFIAEYKIRQI